MAEKNMEKNEEVRNGLEHRFDFEVLFEVKNGNPNGDPDKDNAPRIDPVSRKGIVTDVCIKRKVRDYVLTKKAEEEGYDIYIRGGESLNSRDESMNKNAEKKEKTAFAVACEHYFDVRTFGAVMTKLGTKSGGEGITGPVQFSFAESVDPIDPRTFTITRCAMTTDNDRKEKGDNTMGNKHFVPYGLYRMRGHISANLAKKTGFSEDDLRVLWDALLNMFEDDHSAARGEMATRKLIIFEHNCQNGNCPSYKLFDSVKIEKKDEVISPRCFEDYRISVPNQNEMPDGITITVME